MSAPRPVRIRAGDRLSMDQRHAANAVFALHVAFVALALFGGFAVRLSPWWLVPHLPAVAWSAYVNLAGRPCPLTPLESSLRGESAATGLGDGFVAHYLGRHLWRGATPRQIERLVGVFILGWNALVYALVGLA